MNNVHRIRFLKITAHKCFVGVLCVLGSSESYQSTNTDNCDDYEYRLNRTLPHRKRVNCFQSLVKLNSKIKFDS